MYWVVVQARTLAMLPEKNIWTSTETMSINLDLGTPMLLIKSSNNWMNFPFAPGDSPMKRRFPLRKN